MTALAGQRTVHSLILDIVCTVTFLSFTKGNYWAQNLVKWILSVSTLGQTEADARCQTHELLRSHSQSLPVTHCTPSHRSLLLSTHSQPAPSVVVVDSPSPPNTPSRTHPPATKTQQTSAAAGSVDVRGWRGESKVTESHDGRARVCVSAGSVCGNCAGRTFVALACVHLRFRLLFLLWFVLVAVVFSPFAFLSSSSSLVLVCCVSVRDWCACGGNSESLTVVSPCRVRPPGFGMSGVCCEPHVVRWRSGCGGEIPLEL